MRSATKQRSELNSSRRRNGSKPRVVAEFDLGSLEAELSVIGKSVPDCEWAKLPADYFANLDHYRHVAPKGK